MKKKRLGDKIQGVGAKELSHSVKEIFKSRFMIRTQGKERSKLEVVGIEEKGYQGALRNHRKTILSLKKKDVYHGTGGPHNNY